MCKLFTSVLCWDDVIFCFGVGNFFLSLVGFVVLSAGCVMNVDFNFSF